MKRLMIRAIEGYQRAREGRPSPCRFFPSCSEYAHEAITVHGAGRGGWLTARRLMRCRPFGPSGFDPVPHRHDHSVGDSVHSADHEPSHSSSTSSPETPLHAGRLS